MEAETAADVAARLRESGRFERVEVLKRFASIDDPTMVVLVILVDEGPVKIERNHDKNGEPRVAKIRGPRLMFLPLLSVEDGYGFSYGVRLGVPDPVGPKSQLSVPLTWGGDKRVAVQLEQGFDRGPVTRIQTGASISRRTNPFFDEDDDRNRLWIRGERELTKEIRVGASGSWERAHFMDRRDRFVDGGVDVVIDTRRDPELARNAVYARAAWDHLDFREGERVNRTDLEGRGYLGLIGQTVLVVRALREDASRTLPSYLQPMLGGMQNVRGFKAGSAVGDTLVAGSTELRVPLTSPLGIAKFGVSAFIDAGTVYNKGARLRDQTLERGVGAGVWLSAAVVRLNLVVAHGVGGSTRVHVGTNVNF